MGGSIMEQEITYNGLSPERAGRITASRALDVMAKGKGNDLFGQMAKTYADELSLERQGYIKQDNIETFAMCWGIEHEPDAREIYERSRGVKVDQPGFLIHPKYDFIGCTPDGVYKLDGLIINNEIKCRQDKAHYAYFRYGYQPKDYAQVQMQSMIIAAYYGVKPTEVVSDLLVFNPLFPDHLKAKVFRIEADADFQADLLDRCIQLNELVNKIVEEVSK